MQVSVEKVSQEHIGSKVIGEKISPCDAGKFDIKTHKRCGQIVLARLKSVEPFEPFAGGLALDIGIK